MVKIEKVTLSLPEELKIQAKAKAILERRSLSAVVRELLELYIRGDLPPKLPSLEAKR